VKFSQIAKLKHPSRRVKEKMAGDKDPGYRMVASERELERCVGRFLKADAVGVDLEADSMYHYREKVCLIQIASESETVVIDPLQISDLSALKPLFKHRGICKIFHGADYDVRSLYRDFRIAIDNLFDTEVAARFLGRSASGLDAVVAERYGVALNKKFQRKDWSRRPLPAEMIAYAAEDVRYLLPLARIFQSELRRVGRLSWVCEECQRLSKVRPPAEDDQPLFVNIKGAGRLDRRGLAVLEELLQFRRRVAKKKDRPLFRVTGTKSLLLLAEKRPRDLKQLERCGALSDKQIAMYGEALLKAVQAGMQWPARSLPVYPRRRSPQVSPAVAGRVLALRKWRDRRAVDLHMDPALLCTKALIGALAQHHPRSKKDLAQIREMKNWQRRELGPEILEILKQTG
jgi:ribonuclease D